MYKPRDEFEAFGAGGMRRSAAAAPAVAMPGTGRWRSWIERRYHALDIAHDLAEEIGSARWYRGFATMLTMGAVALACWPDFSAVEAATTVRPDEAVRAEYHIAAIAPLGRGADSGRRMTTGANVVPIAAVPERPRLELVATLGNGDDFARMLQRSGVAAADAARTAEIVRAVMPLGQLDPGTTFAVTLGPRPMVGAPRPLEKLAFRARFDLDLTVERRGGALAIVKQAVPVDETPLRIRGMVGPSLFRSARAAGAPAKAIEQYLQTIAAHLSLDGDIAPTDQFDMIVGYRRAVGGANQVGELLFAGLERDGKPRAQLVRWKEGRFVDAATMDAPQFTTAGMVQPVNGRMTSGYGMRRHPILGYVRKHAGIDFGAASGSPIFAASEGIVAFAGRHGGHGNFVKLDHGGGVGTGYAHMSRIAVAPGAHVEAGQVIGYVGSTGLSTGPHLHYEVYQNGRTVNPLSVSFTFRTAGLDKAELDAVNGKIAALKRVAPGAALQKLTPPKALPAKVTGESD